MRATLAWDGGYNQVRQSLHQLLELKVAAERAIGTFHRVTLNIRRGIAYKMSEVGETREAARIYLRLFEDCIENLNESEYVTYAAMFGYTRIVGLDSTPERAIELLDDFEVWMRGRRAPAEAFKSLRYSRAREHRNARWFEQALEEVNSIAEDEEQRHGRLNVQALVARCEWLECMASGGNPQRALQFAQNLLNEYRASADPQQTIVHYLCRTISTISGESGDATEAIRILNQLRDEKVQWYGENDPYVRGTDFRLRYWTAIQRAHTGDLADAAEDLRRLSEDIAISEGITWGLRGKVLHKLSEITSRLHGELS
jgi:hypothetical protein